MTTACAGVRRGCKASVATGVIREEEGGGGDQRKCGRGRGQGCKAVVKGKWAEKGGVYFRFGWVTHTEHHDFSYILLKPCIIVMKKVKLAPPTNCGM